MDRNDPLSFLVNFKCFVSSYLRQYLHIECISTLYYKMNTNDPLSFLVNFKCFVSSYLRQYIHIECISTCNTKWIEIIY